VRWVQSPALATLHGVRHGFTARSGGDSQGGLASLNLAPGPGESPETLASNWSRVATRLGLVGAPVALLHQIHGNLVLDGDDATGADRVVGEGDAVVVTRPGVIAAVRVADCVPVLLAAPGGVAAIHAGWRGTAAAIVQSAVAVLCDRTGATPDQVTAAVGPCISVDAYEVGDEVVAGVGAVVPTDVFVQARQPRPHVDLKAANAWLLREAGVGRIDVLTHCTATDPGFYSYRRDRGITGRQAGVIAWSP
jgi:polyphenol oxidase